MPNRSLIDIINRLNSTRKKILVSAILNIGLFFAFVVPQYTELSSHHWPDSLIWVFFGFTSDFVALVCLILWIKMLVNPKYKTSTIPIFISVHSFTWGLGFTYLSITLQPREFLYLFYLFPLVIGLLATITILQEMRKTLE
jgi:hypothetical protein